ncbi:MAG: hypothetical protein FJZ98_03855 [Chloroflexi bacterium]|nr:hypothetical protein [Chloroflexota bacterium]
MENVPNLLNRFSVSNETLDAALVIKKAAGQINVVIHTLGIMLSLPYILEKNEVVEALSLGAGNTGKDFDLETDKRVAEFKFIHWQGGPESIRQNQLFKDFFFLAESKSPKTKFLYVLKKEIPLRFFHGGRALKSVMSRNRVLDDRFREIYGEKLVKVNEYYQFRRDEVEIVDLFDVLPVELVRLFG